jgi:hypothetical protein
MSLKAERQALERLFVDLWDIVLDRERDGLNAWEFCQMLVKAGFVEFAAADRDDVETMERAAYIGEPMAKLSPEGRRVLARVRGWPDPDVLFARLPP